MEYLNSQTKTPQNIVSAFMSEIEADVYVVCHCTSPFVSAEHISQCIRVACSVEYDSAFTTERVDINYPKDFEIVNAIYEVTYGR